MQTRRKRTHAGTFLLTLTVLTSWGTFFSASAAAQGSQGQNAVYNSSNGIVGSSAFIDASQFASTQQLPNICAVLNFILNPQNGIIRSVGEVIDARGLNSSNTSMQCATSPWAGITNPPPSTILLPATTAAAPIVISTPWVLPSYTHLIGQGDAITSVSPLGTTIQVSGTFSGSSSMIQFGSSSGCCTAISVENLTLDGKAKTGVSGIVNQYAGDLSYVDHVGLYRILGTGLSVSGSANKSGPYSNITFDLGGNSGTNSTTCASINGLTGTRGIHGLTCISENNVPPAAVLLDSSNNSIEDLRFPTTRITLDIYSRAGMPNKRLAQSKLVRMVLNKGEALA
jgi:hypothetical protein